jgi:hypothetical protein
MSADVKRKPAGSAMAEARAVRFPDNCRIKLLEWDVTSAGEGKVNFKIKVPNQGTVQFSLEADEAYDLRQDITVAYDQAIGI